MFSLFLNSVKYINSLQKPLFNTNEILLHTVLLYITHARYPWLKLTPLRPEPDAHWNMTLLPNPPHLHLAGRKASDCSDRDVEMHTFHSSICHLFPRHMSLFLSYFTGFFPYITFE